ncbi:hypothetical protein P3T37_005533 [Kitasatospora sp. MAA4]|nr:hypothetical protein [Kitasatospora sp. MAA4]
MRGSADSGTSGRIGPGVSSRSLRPAQVSVLRGRVSGGLLRWALAVPLGVLCWWLLLTGGPPPGPFGAVLGLLTLGGWGLGVLPVHCDRRLTGPRRRLTAQPQTAGGGVETGPLQDGAQR